MLQFKITVIAGRKYTYDVIQTHIDNESEFYQIIGNNKIIVLQSNRPLLRGKGLKHKAPTWKIVNGKLSNQDFLEKIVDALMEVVDK